MRRKTKQTIQCSRQGNVKPQSDDIAGAEAIYGKKSGIGSPSTSVGVTPYNPPATQARGIFFELHYRQCPEIEYSVGYT